jgi:hypothetical protein
MNDNGRGSELGKLDAFLREAARQLATTTGGADLQEWFFRWLARHEPAAVWTERESLLLGGHELELGEPGSAKRLELGWDAAEGTAVLRAELSATREVHWLLRRPQEAAGAALSLERRGLDALSVLHPATGLLNMGVNRRIRRKIDSRSLRVELTRSVYERLREQGLASQPGRMRRNDFFRAMRELGGQDPRWTGFTGLLREHSLEELVAEAYGAEPVDELGPQLCLPVFDSYLPEAPPAGTDGPQLRTGQWPTARSRAAALEDLALWAALQQARAMCEQSWSVPLPGDLLTPEVLMGRAALEVPLRSGVPCRRGDVLLLETAAGRRTGKLMVATAGQDALVGVLRLEDGELCELQEAGALSLTPIRSSFGRLARALEALRESVACRRDIALSPALRTMLGLEPLRVALVPERALRGRLSTAGIAEDPAQLEALCWALDPSSPLVLVQGPPGTGKTTLIEEICRQAVAAGCKVAVTAPSHPAVDNALRRLTDLPLLRVAAAEENVAEELRRHWTRAPGAERRFREAAARTGGFVIGGTHIGLLNDAALTSMSRSGLRFDLLIVDECGMSRPEEVLLALELTDRAVLIGDQAQLPPFPLSGAELGSLEGLLGRPLLRRDRLLLEASALEVLAEERGFPAVLLTRNYRCHNPRLVELSSQLFYDSRIRLAECSEYFRLPYVERQEALGPGSLRLYDTAALPLSTRCEQVEWEGAAPGYCSPLEAAILLTELDRLSERYGAEELCLISPYRLQVQLLRRVLRVAAARGRVRLPEGEALERFLAENVTTIDSFQGRECDALLVSYVRSNRLRSCGFVGDPRRNNVTHTRARREMVVVGDLETLTGTPEREDPVAVRSAYVLRRMAEIVGRHGLIVPLCSEAPYLPALELVSSCLGRLEMHSTAS